MTTVEAALLLLCVVSAISVLWLLVYVRRDMNRDRVNGVGGLVHLDVLAWRDWTPLLGWPPMTCWPGCKDLHRADWFRVYLDRTCRDGCADFHHVQWWKKYLSRTCWDGCVDLHRDDWFRVYLDRTCWDGCANLHRADWWKAYLDQAAPEDAVLAPVPVPARRPMQSGWAHGLFTRTS